MLLLFTEAVPFSNGIIFTNDDSYINVTNEKKTIPLDKRKFYQWNGDSFSLGLVVLLLIISVAFLCGTRPFFYDVEDHLRRLNGIRKPFLTSYRSSLLVLTFLAILAVDFRIFPRKFAKTETYGISLMDIGVGSFLVAYSLSVKGKDNLRKSFKSAIPLFLLGLARLIAVKSTNYHEHISEYGIHWNFFFTLAFVYMILPFLLALKWDILLGTILLLVYQYSLSKLGLSDYIGNEYRSTLFSANKEGIYSLIGYTSLALYGTYLGRSLCRERTSLKAWRQYALGLLAMSVLVWALAWLSHHFIEMASRKMVLEEK